MPLSEHEQRVLEQMEQALYAEDPRLASQLKSTSQGGPVVDRRRIALGVIIALAGLGLVLVGVMSQLILVGGLGFLAMVFGGAWAATPARSHPRLSVVHHNGRVNGPTAGSVGPKGKASRKPKPSGTFMQRMEQQWDKRREEGP